jgi:hypothetical protein
VSVCADVGHLYGIEAAQSGLHGGSGCEINWIFNHLRETTENDEILYEK